ncbi:MAG: hypothetical protein IKU29_07035 [Parabacteroides sp.]|nr:hypothetical protein [Parabacteroides sp.]
MKFKTINNLSIENYEYIKDGLKILGWAIYEYYINPLYGREPDFEWVDEYAIDSCKSQVFHISQFKSYQNKRMLCKWDFDGDDWKYTFIQNPSDPEELINFKTLRNNLQKMLEGPKDPEERNVFNEEIEVGTVFKCCGHILEVVESDKCQGCFFNCGYGRCSGLNCDSSRKDGKNVCYLIIRKCD